MARPMQIEALADMKILYLLCPESVLGILKSALRYYQAQYPEQLGFLDFWFPQWLRSLRNSLN